MEDAATAEISRSQVWQWLHNATVLADGQTVTRELVERLIDEETPDGTGWEDARSLYTEMALSDEYVDFLTLPAYERMP
jgi:malate synthase